MSSLQIRRVVPVVVLALGLVLAPLSVQALPLSQPSASVSVDDSGDVFSWFVSAVASFFGYAPVETPDSSDGRAPDAEERDAGPTIDISGAA